LRLSHLLSLLIVALPPTLFAQTSAPSIQPKPVVKNQGFLPFAAAPIHYRTSLDLTDQVTQLNKQLASGERTLQHEASHGYLKSVLEALHIPASSQTLVYSKTSLQFQHISPSSPRALYFNDNVYVGQVHNAKSLELIAFDATQGAVFYVLGEQKVAQPRFERAQLDCVQCHIASATRGIPGVMVRSVQTSPTGNPKGGAPIHTMGHETPIANRWQGWYVSGTLGQTFPKLESLFDISRFLAPSSDVVAHLVLAHQTQMHNLVTETNYRYRLGTHADALSAAKEKREAVVSPETRQSYEKAAEATLRYLLFTSEVPLPSPVQGDSSFTTDFAALGPRDRKGRSLRDFDLQTRLFKYPCSYLIYSDAFDAIPGPARDYLLRRLLEVLSGRDQSADFATLRPEDRRAILEILVDTKPGLPADWKQFLQPTLKSKIN
jgi:hypothetical protein